MTKMSKSWKVAKAILFHSSFSLLFFVFREQNIGNETVEKKKTPWGWHFLFLTKNTSFFSLLWSRNFFHFFLWLFIFFFSTEAWMPCQSWMENIDLLFFFAFNANKNIEAAKKVFFSSHSRTTFVFFLWTEPINKASIKHLTWKEVRKLFLFFLVLLIPYGFKL